MWSHGVLHNTFAERREREMTREISQPAYLSEAVEIMVDGCGKPLKVIAADVGRAYSTLVRELDRADVGAKLGVDELTPLMRACCGERPEESPLPLLWLAEKFGFRLVPERAEPDHADTKDEMLDDHRDETALHEAIRAGMPLVVVDRLAAALHRDIEETVEQHRREAARAQVLQGER